MPQVVVVMIAGAGILAGLKFINKLVGQAKEAARAMDEEAQRVRAAARGPKDLGTLEFDPATNAYRPRAR